MPYQTKKDTVKDMIKKKVYTLVDFCVIERKEKDEWKQKLMELINQNPKRDPQTLIDNYCRPLIMERLRDD